MTTPRPLRLTTRDRYALATLARLRYLTIPLAVAHLGLTADGAYRLLRRLAREGYIRTVRWSPGDRVGPPSIVAVLTAKGAGIVGDEGALDRAALQRVVRGTAGRARDVAAGFITTLAHDLDVLMLATVLTRVHPGVGVPLFGVTFHAPLTTDLGRLSASEQRRLGSTGGRVAYLPDAVLPVPRGALLVELETGKGGRTAEQVGAVKAAKMHAVWRALQASPTIPGLGEVDPFAARFAIWAPTSTYRDGVLAGARRVLNGRDLPLVVAAGDDLPLRVPTSIPKVLVHAWVGDLAATAGDPIWHDLEGRLVGAFTHQEVAVGLQNAPGRVLDSPPVSYDPYGGPPLISA